MNRLVISGAGGGKTTGLVEDIYNLYNEKEEYKFIYVVTYTNYAVKQIIDTYNKKYGNLPKDVKIMTAHKFVLDKIIYPYYSYVFEDNPIEHVVTFEYNRKRKFFEFSKYLERKCIHTDNCFSMAKWLLIGKSNFKTKQKHKVQKVFNYFKSDISSILIDEYQDLEKDFLDIIKKISIETEIYIKLVGDPKQKILGSDDSREFIQEFEKIGQHVSYQKNVYRFGGNLLSISNKLCTIDEQQEVLEEYDKDMKLKYIYYKDYEKTIKKYEGKNTLIYINKKNKVFNTKKIHENQPRLNLEMQNTYQEKYLIKLIELILEKDNLDNDKKILEIKKTFCEFKYNPSKIVIQQIKNLLDSKPKDSTSFDILSINKVKGQESDNCFYIIDNSFFNYLLDTSNRNQESNKIYVGLTRAKEMLCLVVEDGCSRISELENLGFSHMEGN